MWSTLENVSCTLEENVYSSVVECSVYVRTLLSNVSFKTVISLLIFCLDDISSDVSEMLKFPTIFVLLWISSFISINICSMYLGAPILGAYIFKLLYPLGLIPESLYSIFFVSCYSLYFEVYFFFWYMYC